MRKFTLALTLMISLIGCQRDHPVAPVKTGNANQAEIKPFSIKTNAGIDHEFYRDMSLDAFLKTLPTGAVDSVNVDIGKGPQVFALVKVPDQAGKDLTIIRFESSFKTQDGQKIDKQWRAAEGRKSGAVMAIFCLPPSVIDGETKVLATD